MQRRDIPPLTIPSRRRPFSPFGGLTSQSRETVVALNTKDMIQGMWSPKPLSPRNLSTPDLSSNLPMGSPTPHAEYAPRHILSSRSTSPITNLTINPAPLSPPTPSSPSFSMPMTPPPSPLKSSSRPPSRESTKSLPVQIHTPAPPNFPRAFHRNSAPSVNTGVWQNTNAYGEAPQFSRHNVGSNVVMPIPAKGRQAKPIAVPKPSLEVHGSVTPSSPSTMGFLAPPPFRRHGHSRRRSNSTNATLDQKTQVKEPVARLLLESPSQSVDVPSVTSHSGLGSLRARTKSVLDRSKHFVHSRAQAITHVETILGPAIHQT